MKKLKNIYLTITDNPLLGFMPLIVFTAADYSMSRYQALLWGFFTYFLVFIFIILLGGKGRIHTSLFSIVSLMTLSIRTFFYFTPTISAVVDSYRFYSQLHTEVVAAFALLTVLFCKKKIQLFFINTVKANVASSFLSNLSEYFYTAKIVLFVIIGHIVFASAYIFSPFFSENQTSIIIIWVVAPVFFFVLIILEYIRLQMLRHKLDSEEWLAVVDTKGDVIGRIAKSETKKKGNKYLHPVIRIAVMCNGRLFLTPRTEDMIWAPEQFDHPFEKYIQYEHSLDKAARDLLSKCGQETVTPYFSVKYLFDNEVTKRLIFLYTIDVCEDAEDCEFNRQKFSEGKFWSQKQIEENLGTGLFSECFEKEYEYLKNTILLFNELEVAES